MVAITDPVDLAARLIRCPSVTPLEGGAITLLEAELGALGFACHRLPFSEDGTPDVDNLFARLGAGGPHLCFAGHTDVVPPGDEALWTYPPFAAQVADGMLYGRGATDMKGGVACFVAAALAFAAENNGAVPGSISLLITGDEEGPAINGTVKVLDWMARNGEVPDHCLVGEPSNPRALGDMMKIGRRGSLHGHLTVRGTQGHVAYPSLTNNPISGLVKALDRLLSEPLDAGTGHFEPSNLEVTTVDVGNPADNVVPAEARARFNVRFNDAHTGGSLRRLLSDRVAGALDGTGLTHDLAFNQTGDCFLTAPGDLVSTLSDAVRAVTGRTPELSTGGGTSDARFIKEHCPVIEFGLVNATIHQVDERTSLADLETLTEIYQRFIARYFEVFGIA